MPGIACKPNRSPAQRVRFGKEKQHHRSIGRRLRRLMTLWCCFDVAERVGFDLRCGAGRLGLQSAPGALPRALGFESCDTKTNRTPFAGCPVCFGGAGGIRTHVPVKANGFRDRPVMTASIPLRMKFSGRRDRGGLREVEAPSRFELEQSGICSPLPYHLAMAPYGAGNEIRTRYLHLGKVALCQMSYARKWCLRPELNWRHADFQSAALPTELPRQMALLRKTGYWWEQQDSNL